MSVTSTNTFTYTKLFERLILAIFVKVRDDALISMDSVFVYVCNIGFMK